MSCIWPNTSKDTLTPLKPSKTNFHQYPPGVISKDLWPFSTSNNQNAIYGVIHHYASFFSSNPLAAISSGVIFFPMSQYAINDVIYHYASFFNSNSMVAISNGHFNIPTYHNIIKAPNHLEDSSRLTSKCFSVKDQSRHQDVIG
ncbi:hypothetical protein O181_004753 [Austropuccinia psidii MF-1]|uniref:Uncharacterized protein n=1 Tax=Austropuccinia psidii MF-1 TaxID=1389203 RepID=A0A9Q3GEV4_9BASI|nr:hypothetical protein [Austropuccinia psidii MF-1]